jgi:hypothetical protein
VGQHGKAEIHSVYPTCGPGFICRDE